MCLKTEKCARRESCGKDGGSTALEIASRFPLSHSPDGYGRITLRLQENAGNGTECLNWLSQPRGQAQTFRVVQDSLAPGARVSSRQMYAGKTPDFTCPSGYSSTVTETRCKKTHMKNSGYLWLLRYPRKAILNHTLHVFGVLHEPTSR